MSTPATLAAGPDAPRRRQKLKRAAALLVVWAVATEVLLRLTAGPYIAAHYQCCPEDPTLCEIGAAYRLHTQFPELTTQTLRFYGHDPVLGHRLLANLPPRPYLGGRLSTNALGARGRVDHPYARQPGRTRIVAVGDSFTMGQEVDDEQAWAALLEARDPTREVVNLGTSAYGIDQALLMLRREGMRYHPDVVVLGYVSDDLHRNLSNFTCGPKPRFALRGDALALEDVPVPTPESLVAGVRRKPLTWLLLRYLARSAWSPTTPPEAEAAAMSRLGRRLVLELARTAREGGARPVIVRMPSRGDLDNAYTDDAFFELVCAQPGVECVDPRPAMLEEIGRDGRPAQAVIFRAQHYNPLGNRIVADVLDAWLRTHPTAR